MGKWVVDYGAVNLPNNILHKEFETEEEAIEWGKSKVGKTFKIDGWPQEMRITYLHRVYEPDWVDEDAVPIEEVFTDNSAPPQQEDNADEEVSDSPLEISVPANEVEGED